MTHAEEEAFYHQFDSDLRPCEPEPAELVTEDWNHAGDME